MEHIKEILQKTYEKLEHKEVFIPIVIANSIICYKLAHDDEVYWTNFSRKITERELLTLKDIYMFFIDFLPQTSHFEDSYKRKVDHLKEFDEFLRELFIKQKYYYKHPEDFEKHFKRSTHGLPNPIICRFVQEIFTIATTIRFEK